MQTLVLYLNGYVLIIATMGHWWTIQPDPPNWYGTKRMEEYCLTSISSVQLGSKLHCVSPHHAKARRLTKYLRLWFVQDPYPLQSLWLVAENRKEYGYHHLSSEEDNLIFVFAVGLYGCRSETSGFNFQLKLNHNSTMSFDAADCSRDALKIFEASGIGALWAGCVSCCFSFRIWYN